MLLKLSKKRCGFTEGKDFSSFLSESTGGRPAVDHQISISMAKQLCIIQRTAVGRKCREYFISIEEAWNSPEKIMERAMQIAHQRALEAERRILCLNDKIDELEVSLNQSLQYYTVAKYNKTFHKKWNLEQCRNIEKNMAYYCRTHAIQIRTCETNDERFGRVNSYPLTAWNDYLGIQE